MCTRSVTIEYCDLDYICLALFVAGYIMLTCAETMELNSEHMQIARSIGEILDDRSSYNISRNVGLMTILKSDTEYEQSINEFYCSNC